MRRNKINKYNYIKLLEKHGFKLSSLQRTFVLLYGGLIINQRKFLKQINEYYVTTNHFKIDKAIFSNDISWVTEEYSERVGKNLIIVGEYENRHGIISMSSDGYFYVGYDDLLYLLGRNIDEMFHRLINDKGFIKEIICPYDVYDFHYDELADVLYISREGNYKHQKFSYDLDENYIVKRFDEFNNLTGIHIEGFKERCEENKDFIYIIKQYFKDFDINYLIKYNYNKYTYEERCRIFNLN